MLPYSAGLEQNKLDPALLSLVAEPPTGGDLP